jgi:glycerophosphoryl diester phosphodiesterase
MVIGHKGAAAVAPENTLASFRIALEASVDGLECDVHATADGVPVIIHDATVERTTDGTGAIAEMTLGDVKRRDASFGMAAFRGEEIPTLDELLTLVDGKVLLALEYKAMAAVEASIPILKRHDAARWCTAWAFNADVLRELKRLIPDLTRTQNVGRVENWDGVLRTAAELESVGVSLAHNLADADRVASARERGLRFYAWTANEQADWARLIECGVDGIVTDDPARLIKYLSKGN